MTNLHVALSVCKILILGIMSCVFLRKKMLWFSTVPHKPCHIEYDFEDIWADEPKVSTYWLIFYLTSPMTGSLSYLNFLEQGSVLICKWVCIYYFICILICIHFLSGKQINKFELHWYDWQYSNILLLFSTHLFSDC